MGSIANNDDGEDLLVCPSDDDVARQRVQCDCCEVNSYSKKSLKDNCVRRLLSEAARGSSKENSAAVAALGGLDSSHTHPPAILLNETKRSGTNEPRFRRNCLAREREQRDCGIQGKESHLNF